MATKNSLSNTKINVTFQSLLHSNGDPLPADGQEDIYDGSGNKSALKLGRSCNGATVCGPFVCNTLSAGNITGTTINATTINATNINGTFNGSNLMASTQFNLNNLFNIIYPVHSILLNITGINPTDQFTGTTWERIARGRFLMGEGQMSVPDERGSQYYFGPGHHSGWYDNVAFYSVPHHRHTTGGFTEGGNDDWYPIWIGATNVVSTAPYGGSARWVPGDSNRPNWRNNVNTTHGTGTSGPYEQAQYTPTPVFGTRPPAHAIYAWRRIS